MSEKKIKTALVSVFHKDGLDDLLAELHKNGVQFLSTGGTQAFIEGLGYPCQKVEDLTTYPSILGGRVKTLHPKVFGGILGRRELESDQQEMAKYEIPEIDLVVVDLYPFEETVANTNDESAIIEKIDNKATIEGNTYPRSLGLPDGAAVIRWAKNEATDKDEFSVRTTTTTLDNINGINRYTYPAELMFFVDSPIRTSANEVAKEVYKNAPTNQLWSAFLDANYKGPETVNTNTKAVAVKNPIQYGVAKLNLTLTGMSPTLRDAKDEIVSNTSMTTLPLTGVIIGGQHTVGFNMKPQGEQTDVDGRFIYETTVDATNLATEGYKTSTLVLQSYDNEKVPVILEFENNTEHAFVGKDGTVYPGARFYLIGMADPANKGEGDFAGRVFTQDYTTTMSMSVTSLAKAYTCMPDLLAPRLEIGVQVVTKWIQATTTNVEL